MKFTPHRLSKDGSGLNGIYLQQHERNMILEDRKVKVRRGSIKSSEGRETSQELASEHDAHKTFNYDGRLHHIASPAGEFTPDDNHHHSSKSNLIAILALAQIFNSV